MKLRSFRKELDDHFGARLGPSPHRDVFVALEHHAVGEESRESERGLLLRIRTGGTDYNEERE